MVLLHLDCILDPTKDAVLARATELAGDSPEVRHRMLMRLAQDREIVTRFFDKAELRQLVKRELSQRIYEEVLAGVAGNPFQTRISPACLRTSAAQLALQFAEPGLIDRNQCYIWSVAVMHTNIATAAVVVNIGRQLEWRKAQTELVRLDAD